MSEDLTHTLYTWYKAIMCLSRTRFAIVLCDAAEHADDAEILAHAITMIGKSCYICVNLV